VVSPDSVLFDSYVDLERHSHDEEDDDEVEQDDE